MTASAMQLKRRIYRKTARAILRGQEPSEPQITAMLDTVKALHAADGLDTPQPARSLPSIDDADITPERFRALSHNRQHPIVIRGFGRQFAAVRDWSAGHLAERLGDTECLAMKLAPSPQGPVSVIPMRIADFLDRMGRERLYVNNNTDLFASHPELAEDLELPSIADRLLGAGRLHELVTTQVFIGGTHVFSRMHHAPAGNMFLQITGRKRWTLIDPAYTAHMLPVPAQPFQYCMSGLLGFRVQQENGKPAGILANLPRYTVTLEPGDLLYNAPWWWHEVDNLDPFTVGCAIRHVPTELLPDPSWRNQPLLTALSIYPLGRLKLSAAWAVARMRGTDRQMLHQINQRTTERLHDSYRRREGA